MREHGNGMYRTDVYFLSKTMAEFPLYILFPTVFVAICYFMIGLNNDIYCFLICVGIVILVANCAASFGESLIDSCVICLPFDVTCFDILY